MTFPFPSSPHWPPTRMMTTVLLGSWFGPARLQVVEPRVVAAELQLDHAGRTVAVLGDVELGDARPFVRFIVLRPKKKHYNVAILFNAIMTYNITSYKIVEIFDCEIEDFVFAVGLDRANPIPINIAGR